MPTLSLKTYLYAALAALLLSSFGWYTYHERSVEHAKDVAVAKQAVAVVEKKDAVIENTAETAVNSASQIYEKVVAIPSVGDIGVVCSAPRRDPVPGPAAGNSGGQADAGRLPEVVFDPSGDLLTLARSSDALVRDLQAENAALRAEMAAAAKAHR